MGDHLGITGLWATLGSWTVALEDEREQAFPKLLTGKLHGCVYMTSSQDQLERIFA